MHLRYRYLALILTLGSYAALADSASEEVQWQWRVEPQSAQAGDEVQVVFTARIPDGFILYSSDFKAELGPRPAKFNFESNDAFALLGPIEAIDSKRRTDKTFGTQYSYFAGQAQFRQKAKLLKDVANIKGRIDGQTCQEKDGLCALFKEPFAVDVR